MIEIKDLKVNFGEQEVLRGIDWFITPKSRIGLVGDNGAGKTTLLRVLAGSADYEGTITMPKGHSVGYLPQDLVEIGELPLAEYLKGRAGLTEISQRLAECEQRMSALAEDDPSVKGLLSEHERLQRLFESKGGFGFDVEAKQVLKGLGFAPERDAARLTSEFSGGWKMRIALAALLLSHSDIMLLDEPTNHLDTESMEWLESWLRDYRGTIIAVSHDRFFLDKLADTMQSHERCSVVEVMGRGAGHLALYCGLACGAAAILIPERPFDFEKDIIEKIREGHYNGKHHFLIIVAEGVGHTAEIAERIREQTGIETRVTIIGHIQRGGSPSARDRVMASRMGHYAVMRLLEGKTNIVVCYRDSQLCDIPVNEALTMTKDLDSYMYKVACDVAI